MDGDDDGVGERDRFAGGQANDPRGDQPETAELSRKRKTTPARRNTARRHNDVDGCGGEGEDGVAVTATVVMASAAGVSVTSTAIMATALAAPVVWRMSEVNSAM